MFKNGDESVAKGCFKNIQFYQLGIILIGICMNYFFFYYKFWESAILRIRNSEN